MSDTFNRRQFIRTTTQAAGLAAFGSVISCAADRLQAPDGVSAATGRPSEPGSALAEPVVYAADGGVLLASIAIATAPVRIANRVLLQPVTYDGTIPGPTLRARRGDWIELRFINRIVFAQGERLKHHHPAHDAALTNVHYHGLHVPPTTTPDGVADDIGVMIPRNGTQRYRFRIPANHPPGLFWYHPHVHGLVTNQTGRGAAGMLYVASAWDDELRSRGIRHRLMMLQQLYIDVDGRTLVSDDGAREDPERALSLINGQLRPEIPVQPGEVQIWSLCNASTSAFYVLRLHGHTVEVLANDGLPLPAPRVQDHVVLSPGNRVTLAIRASSTAGRYELRTEAFNQGVDTWPAKVLATLVVGGAAWTGPNHPGVPSHVFPQVQGVTPAATRLITFDVNESVPEGSFGRFAMNGHPWGTNASGQPDPDYVEWTSRVNDVEEWVIRNDTPQDHPFHVHTNPFLVLEVTGASWAPPPPAWYDTFVVPRNGGTVRVRTKLEDFTGRPVMHCHILDHEDMGMMTSFRIAPPTV